MSIFPTTTLPNGVEFATAASTMSCVGWSTGKLFVHGVGFGFVGDTTFVHPVPPGSEHDLKCRIEWVSESTVPVAVPLADLERFV